MSATECCELDAIRCVTDEYLPGQRRWADIRPRRKRDRELRLAGIGVGRGQRHDLDRTPEGDGGVRIRRRQRVQDFKLHRQFVRHHRRFHRQIGLALWRDFDEIGVSMQGLGRCREVPQLQCRVGVVAQGDLHDRVVLVANRALDHEPSVQKGLQWFVSSDQQVVEPDHRTLGEQRFLDRVSGPLGGEHQRDRTVAVAGDVVVPVDQVVDIRRADVGQVVVDGDPMRFFVVRCTVHDLDAVQLPLFDQRLLHFGQFGSQMRSPRRTPRVVPEHETPLRIGRGDGLLCGPLGGECRQLRPTAPANGPQRVGVGDEHGIHVSIRGCAGDLRAGDDDQVRSRSRLCSLTKRDIAVWVRNERLMWLVLQVLGDRHRIEPIKQSLCDAHVGPHVAIGEHRVGVQVDDQGQVLPGVGEIDVSRLVCARAHLAVAQGEGRYHASKSGAHGTQASGPISHVYTSLAREQAIITIFSEDRSRSVNCFMCGESITGATVSTVGRIVN